MLLKNLDLQSGPSKYFKTRQGANKFRIVSEAIPVWTAFDRERKTARKYLNENHGDKEAKLRYAMWVIDRADGFPKVAEFGVSIVNQLQELAASEQYGFDDLPKYDMTVMRKGEGMETEYTVIADRQDKALTTEEAALVMGLEDLTAFFQKEIANQNKNDVPF